jgi:hypothetical protein
MSRKRNVLTVPLTDEQAALLEKARRLKDGRVVPKADIARHAIFDVYLAQLGHKPPSPMPPPQSARTARPKQASPRPKRQNRTASPDWDIETQGGWAVPVDKPGKTRVTPPRPTMSEDDQYQLQQFVTNFDTAMGRR